MGGCAWVTRSTFVLSYRTRTERQHIPPHTHTDRQTHTHTYTHTQTRRHRHTDTDTDTHTHSLTHSLAHSLTCTPLFSSLSLPADNLEVDDSSDEEDVPFACLLCRNEFANPVVTKYARVCGDVCVGVWVDVWVWFV